VGTAVSGLFITVIRAIILVISGADNSSYIPAVIYFSLAIMFNIITILMNIYFCNSDVYRDKIDAFKVKHDIELTTENKRSLSNNKSITNEYVKEEERVEKQKYLITMKETFVNIFPYPLILIANYIVTFMLFPGPTLSKTFPGMPVSWSVITFLLSYNIGDTVGKYLGSIDNIFNKYSLIFSLFARIIFFLPIIVLADGTAEEDSLLNNFIFPFMNQFLFGVTNGFVTSIHLIIKIAPSSWPSE
jgi:hypothetical protein